MSNTAQQRDETILITGASGLIGTRLCHRLKDQYALVGLDVKAPDDSR